MKWIQLKIMERILSKKQNDIYLTKKTCWKQAIIVFLQKNMKKYNIQIIIMSKYFDKFEIGKRVDSSNYMSYNAFW